MVYVLGQIVLLWRGGFRVKSFKYGFNLLTFVWCVLRVAFFAQEIGQALHPEAAKSPAGFGDQLLGNLLNWVPQAIQYWTFALLGLFFARMLYRHEWRATYRDRFVAWMLVSDGVFLCAVIIDSFLAIDLGDNDDDERRAEAWSKVQTLVTVALFLVLCVAYMAIGCKLRVTRNSAFAALFVMRPKQVAAIIFTLSVVFTTRMAFDLYQAFAPCPVELGSRNLTMELEEVFLLPFWEVFPVALLLATTASMGHYTSDSGYEPLPDPEPETGAEAVLRGANPEFPDDMDSVTGRSRVGSESSGRIGGYPGDNDDDGMTPSGYEYRAFEDSDPSRPYPSGGGFADARSGGSVQQQQQWMAGLVGGGGMSNSHSQTGLSLIGTTTARQPLHPDRRWGGDAYGAGNAYGGDVGVYQQHQHQHQQAGGYGGPSSLVGSADHLANRQAAAFTSVDRYDTP